MNEQHVARLKQGVESWNMWRLESKAVVPDLSLVQLTGANLRGMNLDYAELISADLTGVDLTDATLVSATLTGATLIDATLTRVDLTGVAVLGANLTGATLAHATLAHANLAHANLTAANLPAADLTAAKLDYATMTGANLTAAYLTGATLAHATLTDANLTDAKLGDTILADVDMSATIGLDTCVHRGPSTLDHRTLLRSGTLPEVFLRGCGLPDALIAYLPSLLNASPIQFFSCFISYSTLDQPFADRLHADLQSKGVRCWFAPHDMQAGKKIHEQIDEAIRVYDRLLLIVSDASMNSNWVKTEIAKARRKAQAQNRHVLFPLALVPFADMRAWEQFDADIGDDSAKEIREFYIPNFTTWKTDHDAYQREFERLLTALTSA